MTIEEAIEVIESIREWSNINPPDYEEVEALDVAIAALCAQQEAEKNEKGCKYCHDGGVWDYEINYCPMCGRKLLGQKEKE